MEKDTTTNMTYVQKIISMMLPKGWKLNTTDWGDISAEIHDKNGSYLADVWENEGHIEVFPRDVNGSNLHIFNVDGLRYIFHLEDPQFKEKLQKKLKELEKGAKCKV